jgi:hypothetical protein
LAAAACELVAADVKSDAVSWAEIAASASNRRSAWRRDSGL